MKGIKYDGLEGWKQEWIKWNGINKDRLYIGWSPNLRLLIFPYVG